MSQFSKKLEYVQRELQLNPTDEVLHAHENEIKEALINTWLEEESALKQKSRDQRVALGDSNTSYFYNLMMSRRARNTIMIIEDSAGNFVKGYEVAKAAFAFFKALRGPSIEQRDVPKVQVLKMLSKGPPRS